MKFYFFFMDSLIFEGPYLPYFPDSESVQSAVFTQTAMFSNTSHMPGFLPFPCFKIWVQIKVLLAALLRHVTLSVGYI